ncbi:putative Radial spoke head protein 9-like protein [Hypsibius exemplaris]|uniref:Radial spoke head protein 9 homolog n=1 Tax=Hypsibius exemplaris TaxID=2072580 RepID=A0A1W0WG10_HYPEX|nr:putative Radial spoke head protein 9-like protein [Hypsibius exemplaris]
MDPSSPLTTSLSTEENLLIRTGCRILESECKQSTFRFWGKVYGTQNDYYIVQSTIIHPFQMPTTYYSRDARIWQTLPAVKPSLRKTSPRLNGMFTGDPTFTSNFIEYHYAGENYYEPSTTSVKEEERLAYLVYCIDSEGFLIPKGSCGLDEKGFLVTNPAYDGMTHEQCRHLSSYLLYQPFSVQKTGPGFEDIGIADPGHNVLKPLSDTLPQDVVNPYGPWLFRQADDEDCVVMENTHWPGLFFWHSVETISYGRCYFGRGDKNIDVPFILSSPEDQDWVVDIGVVPDYDWKAPPFDAITVAEDFFAAEEARLEKLLPPLPEPKKPAVNGPEGESDGEKTEDPSTADETGTSGEPTSAEVTDASDQEEGEEQK